VLLFWASHLPVMRREEAWLSHRWAEVHEAYRARVPALLPTLSALGQRRPVRPRHLLEAVRREADAVCGWTFAAIAFHLWTRLSSAARLRHLGLEVQAMVALALLLTAAWLLLRTRKPLAREVLDAAG
jgi:protein-S-isoprenylcysteine O-methyltransferase Ste14